MDFIGCLYCEQYLFSIKNDGFSKCFLPNIMNENPLNLQVGHNVVIGRWRCMLCGQVGVAGSVMYVTCI